MKFIFLGDVHANISLCKQLAVKNPDKTIVQLGDLGIGFHKGNLPTFKNYLDLPDNFKFFPGNHDDRNACHKLPHCLGDYGEYLDKFFFVSGADSIDKPYRIENISWWRNEELSLKQQEDCLIKWTNSRIDTLVAHDIPQSFAEAYELIYDISATRNLLEVMIDIRKPKLLISGHHHSSKSLIHDDIEWHSLDIDETYSIDL